MTELTNLKISNSGEVITKVGVYIYCIIPITSNKSLTFGPFGIGERGDEIYTICFNNIGAIVSNSLVKKYSVSRENTIAHEKAIEMVMKEDTVLPVRFATIAEDEHQVKNILEKEYNRFKDLLEKMKGKKELGLKAVFKEDIIYKEILEKYKDIKSLKEKIAKLPSQETYYQRMEIGKLVEQALEKEKQEYKELILNVLNPLAEDIKINDNYGERMIINAAFLVNEAMEKEFDEKIQGLDEKYGNKIKFKYIGTLPPFNFVNLEIKTGL